MVAGAILNITARGLSAGAKVILKQLKTLIKKPKKTTTDRKKITKLKKELNADKSVKEKKLQAKKDRFDKYVKTPRKIREKGDTKQMKGEEKHRSGYGSKKSEIDHDYYQELNRSLKTGDKMRLPKGGNKKAKEKAFYDELENFLKTDQKKRNMTPKELEADYRKGLPREMKKAGTLPKTPKQIKKQVRKVVAEEFKKYGTRPGKKGFSTGGLSSKNYVNPVKFVNNLTKQ